MALPAVGSLTEYNPLVDSGSDVPQSLSDKVVGLEQQLAAMKTEMESMRLLLVKLTLPLQQANAAQAAIAAPPVDAVMDDPGMADVRMADVGMPDVGIAHDTPSHSDDVAQEHIELQDIDMEELEPDRIAGEQVAVNVPEAERPDMVDQLPPPVNDGPAIDLLTGYMSETKSTADISQPVIAPPSVDEAADGETIDRVSASRSASESTGDIGQPAITPPSVDEAANGKTIDCVSASGSASARTADIGEPAIAPPSVDEAVNGNNINHDNTDAEAAGGEASGPANVNIEPAGGKGSQVIAPQVDDTMHVDTTAHVEPPAAGREQVQGPVVEPQGAAPQVDLGTDDIRETLAKNIVEASPPPEGDSLSRAQAQSRQHESWYDVGLSVPQRPMGSWGPMSTGASGATMGATTSAGSTSASGSLTFDNHRPTGGTDKSGVMSQDRNPEVGPPPIMTAGEGRWTTFYEESDHLGNQFFVEGSKVVPNLYMIRQRETNCFTQTVEG